MMMIQQAYPHFVSQQLASDQHPPKTVIHHEDRNMHHDRSPSPTITMVDQRHPRVRSVSPPQRTIIYKHEPVYAVRPQSPSPPPSEAPSNGPVHLKYDHTRSRSRSPKRRCASVDDDQYYDDDAHHTRIVDDRQYDSEDQDRRYDQQFADEPSVADDDDNKPLDLSLPIGRRRDRTFSGTDSDDSGEGKAGGKAAYKKSLMKRYCKYFIQN